MLFAEGTRMEEPGFSSWMLSRPPADEVVGRNVALIAGKEPLEGVIS